VVDLWTNFSAQHGEMLATNVKEPQNFLWWLQLSKGQLLYVVAVV